MSDSETDYEENRKETESEPEPEPEPENDDVEREYNDDDDDYSDDEKYDKPAKKNTRSNVNVKYSTDGWSREQYNGSNKEEEIFISECCGKYYRHDAAKHTNSYGLAIEGIKTCIHCYFHTIYTDMFNVPVY